MPSEPRRVAGKRMVLKYIDFRHEGSLTARMRQRRFSLFLSMLNQLPKSIKILDVGGTEQFWRHVGFNRFDDCQVNLLNRRAVETTLPNFSSVAGDARDLTSYDDGTFDVVFSNSVIEHVGNIEDQSRIAAEVQRLGKYYFVQTPNYYFPVEPHFQFPCFQYLPVGLRAALTQHFSLGWYPRARDISQARQWVNDIRLLSRREVQLLFPDARIVAERWCGWPKSFLAIRAPNGGFRICDL